MVAAVCLDHRDGRMTSLVGWAYLLEKGKDTQDDMPVVLFAGEQILRWGGERGESRAKTAVLQYPSSSTIIVVYTRWRYDWHPLIVRFQ